MDHLINFIPSFLLNFSAKFDDVAQGQIILLIAVASIALRLSVYNFGWGEFWRGKLLRTIYNMVLGIACLAVLLSDIYGAPLAAVFSLMICLTPLMVLTPIIYAVIPGLGRLAVESFCKVQRLMHTQHQD